MKLRNPGPVRAAPALDGLTGELAAVIGSWPGVASFTHWRLGSPGIVDGAEYHVGDLELGHIHLDGTAHIPVTSRIATMLEGKGLGRTPSWSDAWITYPVRSASDLERASWLFRLAYARVRGASEEEVIGHIESRTEPVGE